MAEAPLQTESPESLRPGDLPPIRLREADRERILSHCREGLPYEACGLLFGNGREAIHVVPMRNAARSTTFFSLDPQEQLQVMEDAREAKLDLIGIFHSHPVTRPYPSRTDVEFAGFWEECWFLIASFRREDEPELCCYRIIGDQIVETGMEVIAE
ncbi:MAG: M67 family metallopeptidase [Armatimonadetes bacterium]|nr:M67 family metallopeptidase [Armatimonadota bacterium]